MQASLGWRAPAPRNTQQAATPTRVQARHKKAACSFLSGNEQESAGNGNTVIRNTQMSPHLVDLGCLDLLLLAAQQLLLPRPQRCVATGWCSRRAESRAAAAAPSASYWSRGRTEEQAGPACTKQSGFMTRMGFRSVRVWAPLRCKWLEPRED